MCQDTLTDRGTMALGYTSLLLLIVANISPVKSAGCSNIPISQNPQVRINETTKPGTAIQNWTSIGETYTITPKTDLYISKDRDEYSLVLIHDVDLDKPSNVVEDFTFTITCKSGSDSGIFFRGTVIILPVDEYAPQFNQSSYNVNISEMIANETFIFVPSATDRDYKSRIDYSILDGTDHFALKGSTTSGVIVNTKLFDYDFGLRLFKITLIATDNAGQKGYADLFVHIQDFDDQSPRFGQLIYRLTVKEKTNYPNALKTEPALEAHDLDYGINATVTYFLESGAPLFGIDPSNGEIRIHRTLDVNTADEYLLEVKAAQTDNPTTRFDRCTVIVTVQDINNNPPQMNKTVYSVSINENSAKDSPVLQVVAYDLDKGDNAVFEYHLNDPTRGFVIDAQNGKVTVMTSATLDREAHVMLQFQVYAKETLTSEKRESQHATVTVTLLDVNDNSPVFHPPTYEFTIDSTIKAGDLIGTVSAADADAESNAVVRYSVIYSSISAYISINDINGQLTLTKILPVPTRSSYEMTIKAEDQDKVVAQRRNSVTTVKIKVNKANSHPPVFSMKTYTVSIPENEPTGTYLTQLSATDRDGDDLTFTIVAGNVANRLLLNGTSGILLQVGRLDREELAVYTLSVHCSDGRHIATATVKITVIDVNDNPPVFAPTHTSFRIAENTLAPTVLGAVQATDADAGVNKDVLYSLSSMWSNTFTINPTSGSLSTKVPLDYEVQSSYQVTVYGRDRGTPSLTGTILVNVNVQDVNDNAPLFLQGANNVSITLREASQPTSFFQATAVDLDKAANAEVVYSISAGDRSIFSINPTSGEISARQPLMITTADSRVHVLQIKATNMKRYTLNTLKDGILNILVYIQDVNNRPAVFTQPAYTFHVNENVKGPIPGGRVFATDADLTPRFQSVRYWISRSTTLLITIDEKTGQLSLQEAADYDPPANQHNFTLTVSAGNYLPDITGVFTNSTTEVVIQIHDVNDNTPQFSADSYYVNMTENRNVPYITGLVVSAEDLDSGANGEVEYYLNDYQNAFNFSVESGKLLVIKSLDYDLGPHGYTVPIVARDKGHPFRMNSTYIYVNITNINDNAPRFMDGNLGLSVDQDAPLGFRIGQVIAEDIDGDRLTYTILGDRGPYVISSDGWLSLEHYLLDLTTQTLLISVYDGIHRTETTVIIKVNDVNHHSPVFDAKSFSCHILENNNTQRLNRPVCRVNATDEDTGKNGVVSYTISPASVASRFHVSNKGEIETGAVMDREKQDLYVLIVTATDGGSNARMTSVYVNVTIDDVNDNPPVFSNKAYHGTVKENSAPGASVAMVPAVEFSDADSLDVGRLVVTLEGPDGNYFAFQMATNTISVSSHAVGVHNLDRELKAQYNFTIVVTDTDRHHATSTVTIDLLDVVDSKPNFSAKKYAFSVPEDASSTRSLGLVSATDQDLEPILHYTVLPQYPFYISDESGVLHVAGSLDRESMASYNFTITVTNQAQLQDTAEVTVTVLDVNDNPPLITQPAPFTFAEEQPPGSTVGKLTAYDADEGINGEFIFHMQALDTFSITSTGVIRSVKVIDRDTLVHPFFDLTVYASDRGQPSLSSSITVQIEILNINDNTPAFSSAQFNFSIDEDAVAGTSVAQLEAADADGDELKYSLEPSDPIVIDANTGWLILQSAPLNLSKRVFYAMRVTVSDSVNHTDTTDVRITVNDVNFHSPVFKESSVNCDVSENKPQNTDVCILKATDKDGGKNGAVSYSIAPDTFSGLFTISQEGQIKTKGILDTENRASYMLIVVATDHGANPRQSTCYVTVEVIDMNDNKVKFTHATYRGTIKENSPTGNEVKFIPPIDFSDADSAANGKLTAHLQGTDSQYFDFNLDTKIISVSPSGNGKLDREVKPSYHLKLVITDLQHQRSTADLVVDLLDEIDTTPVFLRHRYTFNVSEGDIAPVRFGTVSATDPDLVPMLRYTLSDANIPFYVVDTTGDLYVAGHLDRETVSSYVYNVTVQNEAGLKDVAEVDVEVLDVNDNAPSINKSQTFFSFTEEQPPGTSVGSLVASDPDEGQNGMVTFSLQETDMFKITANGDIQSSVVIDFDTLTLPIFDVLVLAVDGGQPALTSSVAIRVRILNINDNAPAFQSALYSFSVDEDAAAGTRIGQLEAADIDGDTLTYSLDRTDVFSIDAKSAWISLHRAPLNLRTAAFYELTVTVTDAVHNVSASVHMTVNDVNLHSPVFTAPPTSCHVAENDASQKLDVRVCTLSANDRDAGKNGALTYSLLPSQVAGLFNISQDGVISTAGILDREAQDSYNLIVMAMDHGVNARKTSAYLTVLVDDVNDNYPAFSSSEYTGTIKENAQVNAIVTVNPPVEYHDADLSDHGKLIVHLKGDDSSYFTFNDASNIISVSTIGNGKLDREAQPLYQLKLIVEDTAGHLTVSNISIVLLDVVDSTPIFKSHMTVFKVTENQPLGNNVGSVTANDADLEPALRYAITTDGVPFYIAELTGDIFVSGSLDREVMANYSFNVTVRNKANLQDGASVVVNVMDENDNAPQISTPEEPFLFKEEQPAGTLVGNIIATDPDEGENGRVTLFMNETEYFSVTATGEIRSTVKIDREQLTRPSFSIIVFAVDHGIQPLSSSVNVQITIEDINDNKPTFCGESKCDVKAFYANVVEKAPIGSIIALVRTKDDDAGRNGDVKLSLQGPTAAFFAMDPTLGVITIKKSIDFNLLTEEGFINATVNHVASLKLEIVASDSGQPPLTNTAELRIQVGEINDQTPVFTESIYKWSVAENQDPGTVIGRVSASVRNATNIHLTYSTVNTDFHVDSLGSVSTARMFDRETVDSYIMAVKVTDGRLPERTAYCVVMVTVTDVNDNPPVFASTQFTASVVENKASTIHTLTAQDADLGRNAKIVYSLVDGVYDSFVTLNSKTGELEVKATVDREKTPKFWIDIMAQDMGTPPLNSTARVTFIVQDVNDNKPEFYGAPYNATVIFDESVQNVLTIFANDSDVGLNSSVTYRIQPRNGPFVINEITGQIQCIAANMYGYQSPYILTVDAQDLGKPPQKNSAAVTVFMISVDKPQFVPKLRQVMVSEATAVGGNFLNVTAGGGDYHYNITDGNMDDFFQLNSVNGHLSLGKSLKGHRGDFLLTILATDVKSLFSDTLKVVILIVNTEPTFPQDTYEASVLENSNPPILVVDLNTTLELSGQPVIYTFTHKTDIFSLNTSSGQVYCMKKLDREVASSYVIEVRANRPIAGKRRKRAAIDPSLARVSITVGDVNDNPPRFGAANESFIIGIPASFTTYYLVTEMVAHDPDEGFNGAIAYNITGGDSNLFSMNAENGEIRTKVGYDKVDRRKFILHVRATDRMGKGLWTNATVEIVVVSDSDKLVLVAAIKPSMFDTKKHIIISNMSAILGYEIRIDKHVPHVELTSDGSYVNVDITDMYFHAIDLQTRDVVPREKVFAKMKENHATISEFFTRLNLREVKPVPVLHPPYKFSEAEIALLAVSLIILVGSLIGIAVVCLSYRRRKNELLKHEQAVKAREKAHDFPVTALNPLYKGVNKDSESGDAMELSVLTREFEIQEKTIDVLDEEILTTNIDEIVPYIITSTDATASTSEVDRSPDVTQNKVNFTDLPDLLNKDEVTRISIDHGVSSDTQYTAPVHEDPTKLPEEAAESTAEGSSNIYINVGEEAMKTEQPGASTAEPSESGKEAEHLSAETSLRNASVDVSYAETSGRQQVTDDVTSSDDSKMSSQEPPLKDGGEGRVETGDKSQSTVSSDIPQTPPYNLLRKSSLSAGSENSGDAAMNAPLTEDNMLLCEVMKTLGSIGDDQDDETDSLNQSHTSSVVVDVVTYL